MLFFPFRRRREAESNHQALPLRQRLLSRRHAAQYTTTSKRATQTEESGDLNVPNHLYRSASDNIFHLVQASLVISPAVTIYNYAPIPEMASDQNINGEEDSNVFPEAENAQDEVGLGIFVDEGNRAETESETSNDSNILDNTEPQNILDTLEEYTESSGSDEDDFAIEDDSDADSVENRRCVIPEYQNVQDLITEWSATVAALLPTIWAQADQLWSEEGHRKLDIIRKFLSMAPDTPDEDVQSYLSRNPSIIRHAVTHTVAHPGWMLEGGEVMITKNWRACDNEDFWAAVGSLNWSDHRLRMLVEQFHAGTPKTLVKYKREWNEVEKEACAVKRRRGAISGPSSLPCSDSSFEPSSDVDSSEEDPDLAECF